MPASSSKRKRHSAKVADLSNGEPPPDTSEREQENGSVHEVEDKHALFTQWAKDRDVDIDSLKPAQLAGRGLGLVTTKAVKKGHYFLFVPEKAMFKPYLPLLKRERLLQGQGQRKASPQAQLALSALVAFSNDDSSLKVWSSTWPTPSDVEQSMPMCWPPSLQQLLPPSVQQPLERQLMDYRNDCAAVSHVCESHGFSEREFRYFWMIVNSRSFHWKKPGRNESGTMVMVPFIDYLNHGPTGSGCNVAQTAYGYEVTAERDYALYFDCCNSASRSEAGEEVLATYGAHSNDKLLVHYGFMLPSARASAQGSASSPSHWPADDDVRLDHLIIPQLSAQIQGQLQNTGFLGSYALLPASNELCFRTQVAVRAKLLTCNEWEYFVTNGEDLAGDHSEEVEGFVGKLLGRWREEALKKIDEILKLEYGNEILSCAEAEKMVVMRWVQIIEGLDRFLEG